MVPPLVQECLDRALLWNEYTISGDKTVYGQEALGQKYERLNKLMSNEERANVDLDASWLDDLRIYS